MPVQTSPPSLPDSFPSFMSVFGGESHISLGKEEQRPQIHPLRLPTNVTVNNTSRRPLPFQHRESVSSVTSGSADSSPTTTVSTFDSPITSDTSPGSSPESPTSMPLSYSKFMAVPRNFENQALSTAQSHLSNMTSDLPQRRPDSPGRRDRNLKNLSLRMPPPLSSRPSISTASVVEASSQHHLSAPPSPINMPPKGIRRKPAGLTIRTPGFDRSFTSNIPELVPPTPSGRLSLRHTESSPSLTSVFSPSFGPKGGMSLPRPSTQHGYRRPSAPSEDNLSPVPSVAGEESASGGALHELAEEDDHPLDSRESAQRSERGYPNGPIQIYDSGVFLYLEPTMEEASKFDVVVNVAKEVTNPFKKTDGSQTVMSTWRNGAENLKRQSCSTPFTALSDTSFKSAFEYLPGDESSPTTPRNDPSGPEYVHVGWDHNSEILDDLYPLCELIDSRISQGKKVLVHCQLGASRSASLVIAYGLFKNRALDFNSMYETVKERSRWVSPNMSLIYQLTDFRSRLVRGSRPSSGDWSCRGSAPQTPLSGRGSSQTDMLGAAAGSPDTALLSANTFSQSSFSSNSLSVPSTDRTTPVSANSLRFPTSLSKKRSVSPRPLALRQSFFNPETSKTESGSGAGPSSGDSPAMNAFKEPALFSPRTTGFLASRPRPLSGILEDGQLNGLSLQIADPRSPPQGQERLIMRNIDEFL
ncbi:hypothetical protein BJX63DRAFT_320123 [Aspergillus granulosus]|uniref:protein-tyrosine-phosphatase n=1 Tax=Aspergillus granulosus TaxID=176169 RepID=A0ABR4H599_9EURO